MGPAGADGATGAAGPAGAGAAGAVGAIGPAGATGPTGATGPAGPGGVAQMAFAAGSAGTVPPAGPVGFIGPTVQASITVGQKVYISSNSALGSTAAGGGTGLTLYPCYQSTVAGSFIVTIGGNITGLSVPQNIRMSFGITGTATIGAAGTYNLGMCGFANANTFQSNDWGYTSIIVAN